MLRLLGVATMFVVVGFACEEFEPCGEYVDYMCECHTEDEGFDCDELRQTYGDADAEVQNQCAIDLADQQAEDDETGACAVSEDTAIE